MTTETHAATHPTLEELAAFIDGMLPESERARVMEHLASCRDCEEVFAETARFQLDHPEEAAGVMNIAQFPVPERNRASRSTPRWLPLAAAALLAVAVGWTGYRLLSEPRLMVAELIEPLEAEADLTARGWNWPVYRSGNVQEDPLGEDFDRSSFQIGALLVDWLVSLNAGEVDKVSRLSQQISNKLQAIPFVPLDGLVALFQKDWTGQPDPAHPEEVAKYLEALRASAERREKDIHEVLAPSAYLSFGKWAEAARLAAVTENPDFFERRDNRRFPSWFLREERDSIEEPEVATALHEIQAILGQDEIDYDTLKTNLETILTTYDD